MGSRILLAVLVVSGCVNCAIDNVGREFVLAFMDNYITGNMTHDIEIYITTSSNTDAQVNVTTPLYDPSWMAHTTVSRGDIQLLSVPATIRGAGVTLDGLGVHIISSQEITVYAINKEMYSTDAFIAYPIDALGSDYIAITWDYVPEIMVASIIDGTTVTFDISSSFTEPLIYDNTTYHGGDAMTVTLDAYQTFHIISQYGDLSGTRIKSSNSISVFSGNYKTVVADTNTADTSDHLVEQLVATQSWGTEFVTFPSPDRNVGDFFRVFASEDGTEYTHNGTTYALDMNEYKTHNVPSDEYYWVSSNKGIQVAMFSKTIGNDSADDGFYGGDPAMSLCVPVALYGSDYTWSTVTTTVGNFTNYIIVVSLQNYTDDLVLDNENIDAAWKSVLGNSDYVGTFINVSPGAHSIYNRLPSHSFLGMAYGNAEYNSYAYASGLRLNSINLPCSTTVTSPGDGEDNDCDGKIDEETENGIDDDGDGDIDEDLALTPRVDGRWSDWGAWGSCSSTCDAGSGTQARTRACDNPLPANYGLDCAGTDMDSTDCTGPSTPCPIDGEWGAWGAWGTCPVTCGSGYKQRSRPCDNPPAQYGGNCYGSYMENSACAVGSYCLPSFYGNPDQGCDNTTQFGCATGGMQCLDISFRCDGMIDCDDGTDESPYFTGCAFPKCLKSGTDPFHGGRIRFASTSLLLAYVVYLE